MTKGPPRHDHYPGLRGKVLETTDLAVDLVAERAGFGIAPSLRQQISAGVGLSPSSYRRRFRAEPG